jgi:membrane-bound lytic murein transglycosylase B
MIPCAPAAALFIAFGLTLTLAGIANGQQAAERADAGFERFVADLWKDAKADGISRDTFERAFAGVMPDPRVMRATQRQPEYNRPAGDYVNSAASPQRAAEGVRKEAEWRATLGQIEKRFQVERWIVVAIWGMETSYGALKPQWDVVRSLATLAHAGYRYPFFRNELLTALRILQDGHIARAKLKGSWAGAMGQPQFMPSSFTRYSVDFDGDGKRDIWSNVPDVLASTANYLQKRGWRQGVPWGFEVTVPKGFDLMKSRGSFAEWTKLGVRRADGRAYPATGDGILFFPTGIPGPAFVITSNFDAIKEYNDSDVYALAIGHLADRMRGAGPFKTPWPKHGTQLPRDDRIALQKRLAELGYDQKRFSAHIDFKMRDFIRSEQKKHGLLPDGHPDAALLERMGIGRAR